MLNFQGVFVGLDFLFVDEISQMSLANVASLFWIHVDHCLFTLLNPWDDCMFTYMDG